MMQFKSASLAVFLLAGLVVTGGQTPAWADQGRGDKQRGSWSRAADMQRGTSQRLETPRPEVDRSNSRRYEQDAARRAMLDGQVMPFSVIKRRVERDMDGASYLGSEFDDRRGEYRLKYMMDGRVLWVDVDGRSGDIVRRSR